MKVIEKVERVYKDHRDFYPLVSLINSGHIGYAGEDYDPKKPYAATYLAKVFQCYSKGHGPQSYEGTDVALGVESEKVYFYIGPKGVEYFETRRADNKKLLISAGFSLSAGVIVAVLSFGLKYIAG
jgi:hypothetical protein